VYCQITPMTGIRISGKMSTGVPQRAQRPDDQEQQRQHDERIWPVQGNTDQLSHGTGIPAK
jgi:hypothetical protein